jgi:hypothetical protein
VWCCWGHGSWQFWQFWQLACLKRSRLPVQKAAERCLDILDALPCLLEAVIGRLKNIFSYHFPELSTNE